MKRHRQNRSANNNIETETESTPTIEQTPAMQMFKTFQTQLDTRHDRHERLVKLSRDVTIESKRIIFQLHRIDCDEAKRVISCEVEQKLKQLQMSKWKYVAEELQDEDPYQFLRAYSPGLQEYIEALSFWFYICQGTLISLEQVEATLTFIKAPDVGIALGMETTVPVDLEYPESAQLATESLRVHIPPMEYILGLADLTGELMRMAISSAGRGDLKTLFEICQFIQTMHNAFVSFGNASRDLTRKLTVLRQSLKKVEAALYMIRLRGSEIPKHLLANVLARATSGPSAFEDADDYLTEDF